MVSVFPELPPDVLVRVREIQARPDRELPDFRDALVRRSESTHVALRLRRKEQVAARRARKAA